MERCNALFDTLARHEKGLFIDTLTFIIQRQRLRQQLTDEGRHYSDYTRAQSAGISSWVGFQGGDWASTHGATRATEAKNCSKDTFLFLKNMQAGLISF